MTVDSTTVQVRAADECFLVALPKEHHDTASHQGWPTEPFFAVEAVGQANSQFWHRLRNVVTGQVLDLPPMYRLFPVIPLTPIGG